VGQSPQQYSRALASRRTAQSPFAKDHIEDDGAEEALSTRTSVPLMPSRPKVFSGLDLNRVRGAIDDRCFALLPSELTRLRAYLIYRFASASLAQIECALGKSRNTIRALIAEIRQLRAEGSALAAMLWRIEWSLRWRLLAAPWRC